MCSEVGTGSVLELQQLCEEFCENHVGCGLGLLLWRMNNGIIGFHKPQHSHVQFGLFIQNLHFSCNVVKYPQLTVCESLLVLLIIYRWSHKAAPCSVTDTEFDGCINIIIYISASLKLDKSETGRCNILEV